MLKRLLAVFTAMLFTLATFAFAAELREDHPTTYTVRKGDTLWDISARFLKQPWLWPEIWQANPQVQNPHRIYPGDVLSLVYLNGQPAIVSDNTGGPQVKIGEAVDTVPLDDIRDFLKQLSVVDDVKSLPYVIGIEEGRLMASSGQAVYVRGMANPQTGQIVQFVRPMSVYAMGKSKNGHRTGGLTPLDARGEKLHSHWSYRDAPTEAHGAPLGYEVVLQGTGEITQVQGEIAVVLLRGEERGIHIGDRVMAPENTPYDATFYPHPPTSIPDGAGVLAVPDGITFSGVRSVIALSVGASDGVKNGTTFSVWHDGEVVSDRIKHGGPIGAATDKIAMPDDYLGHVMVFRTFNHVSYALVMDGIRPIRVGDMLRSPDATR